MRVCVCVCVFGCVWVHAGVSVCVTSKKRKVREYICNFYLQLCVFVCVSVCECMCVCVCVTRGNKDNFIFLIAILPATVCECV
jgi:hypothetical protein